MSEKYCYTASLFAAAFSLNGIARAGAAVPVPETPGQFVQSAGKAAAAKLFTDFTAETFRGFDRAQQKIDPGKVEVELLSAAVFHETNKRRSQEKLPPLRPGEEARVAAQMQAEIMAARGSISHVNPELPGRETPADRLRLAGVKTAFLAENVALTFGLTYKAGEAVYVRGEKKKIFSRQPDGEPLPMHTYLSLAESLLDLWMKSPEHRKNILSEKPVFLGAGLQLGMNAMGMPVFYGTQVFYAPLPEAGKPK